MENIIVAISRLIILVTFPILMYQALVIETIECGDEFYVEALILAVAIAVTVRAEFCKQIREENRRRG